MQVQGNRAGNGGGMQIASNRPASIHASAFIQNDAHTGGALAVQTTELTISQSTF